MNLHFVIPWIVVAIRLGEEIYHWLCVGNQVKLEESVGATGLSFHSKNYD